MTKSTGRRYYVLLTSLKLSKIQWVWVIAEYNFESSTLLKAEDPGASAATVEANEFDSMQ